LPKGVARTNEAFEVEKIRNPNIETPAFAKAATRRQARQIRIFNSNFVEHGLKPFPTLDQERFFYFARNFS
jgi:hypothetical protein